MGDLGDLCKDLDFLRSLSLLLLGEASEEELEVAEDALPTVLEGLGYLFLVDQFLEEALLETSLQLLVATCQPIVHVSLLCEQIQGLPENVQQVGNSVFAVDLEVLLDEDEVVDYEIADPLQFVRFETAFVLVPRPQVLTDAFAVLLDMLEEDLLRELIRLRALPDCVHHVGLDHVQVEQPFGGLSVGGSVSLGTANRL